MSKNIIFQMQSAVNYASEKGIGTDKHSDKCNGETGTYKIYSYASRKEMIDFSWDFGRYIKDKFPKIRKVKDIDISHINTYLDSKKGISENTMKLICSNLNKLELCVEKFFKVNVDWQTNRIVPKQDKANIRHVVFTDAQIEKIDKCVASKRDCFSKDGYLLARFFGLRSASICKLQVQDVSLENRTLHIHNDKGGRNRDLRIPEEAIPYLKKMIEGKSNPTDRLVPLRPDSICAYLNRICKSLNTNGEFDKILKGRTSIHCLRKYVATSMYKELVKTHPKKEAENLVCKFLGHGENRKDIIGRYIFI